MASSSSSSAGGANDTTAEQVASFLMQGNYLLTALEFHTELKETSGIALPLLATKFDAPPPSSMEDVDGADPPGASSSASGAIEEEFKNKLAAAERELQQSKEHVEALKRTLKKARAHAASRGSSNPAIGGSNGSAAASLIGAAFVPYAGHAQADGTAPSYMTTPVAMPLPARPERDHEAIADDEAVDDSSDDTGNYERKLINFIVHRWLVEQGYKLSAITMMEEVEEFDEMLDPNDEHMISIPEMLLVFRHFYGGRRGIGATATLARSEALRRADIELVKAKNEVVQLNKKLDATEAELHDVRRVLELVKQQKISFQSAPDGAGEDSTTASAAAGAASASATASASSSASSSSSVEPTYVAPNIISSSLLKSAQARSQSSSDATAAATTTTAAASATPSSSASTASVEPSPSSSSAESLASTSTNASAGTSSASAPNLAAAAESESSSKPPEPLELSSANYRRVARRLNPLRLPNVPVVELDESTRIGQQIDKIVTLEGQPNSAALIAADCLPHIVPGVILNKREELIPLFLTSIQQHPLAAVRDDLTRLLFNLIRKPNRGQRRVIMDGCVALASLIGHERTEVELLPQCWEQISDKYEERRVLVGESCGALVRFVKPSLRESLLVSILQQLMEDRTPMVRESVARNLAIVISHLKNEDKYAKVEELLLRLLYDPCIEVVSTVQNILLPVFIEWSDRFGYLTTRLVPLFLDEVRKLVMMVDPSGISEHNAERLQLLLGCTFVIIPRAFERVVTEGPFDVGAPTGKDTQTGGSSCFGLRDESSTLLSQKQCEQLLAKFNFFLSTARTSKQDSWKELAWATDSLVPRLIDLVGNAVSISVPLVARGLIGLMKEVCLSFGSTFTLLVLKKQVSAELESEKDKSAAAQARKGRLAIVYFASILTSLDDRNEAGLFLRELIVNISLEEYGWSASQVPVLHQLVSVIFTTCNRQIQEDVVSLLTRDMVVHPAIQVRVMLLALYNTLIEVLPTQDLEKRILPAVITLSNDMDLAVRKASIRPLGNFAVSVDSPGTLERVNVQFEAFLMGESIELVVETVNTFALVIPNIQPAFRDQKLLPALIRITDVNHKQRNATNKGQVVRAILEAYRAFAACSVSAETLSSFIIPGLKLLMLDIDTVPTSKPILEALLRDMEAALERDGKMEGDQGQAGFFSRFIR